MTSTIEQVTTALPVGTWAIDPAHSTVGFEVRDMANLVATIRGRFTDYEGRLEVGEDGARASGAIRVASVNTDQPQRDEHLRSPDFLDAGSHPEIRFESDSIEVAEGDRVRVAGRLVLKGDELPVALDVDVLGHGVDAKGVERLALAGETEIGFGPMRVKLVVDVSAVRDEG